MVGKHRETEQKDQTRERLIAAGLEMLVTKGYRAATTREITRAAELTEVTMYRHFRSKDELFAEAISQYRQALLELVPAPSGHLQQDLQTLVASFYEHIAAASVKMMQVIPELKRHCAVARPQVHMLQSEFHQRLHTLFQHYQTSGELRADIGDQIVIAFMGPIYYYAAQEEKDQHLFLASGQYVELFIKGYGVP